MSRAAAIDIGTNSVLLLVAERDAGELRPVVESAQITRLGRAVDGRGRIADDALARTLTCLERYDRELRAAGASRLAIVGTSALRDAENAEAARLAIAQVLGVMPEVIDGQREAELTFRGALTALDVRGRVGLFDVGGGSTEIVFGTADAHSVQVEWSTSIDVGSVRLTERHLLVDPPQPLALQALRRDAEAAFSRLDWPPLPTTVVGVAGTVTTLAAIDQALLHYDPARVHGSRLSASRVRELAAKLGTLALSERRQLRGLEPARADIIVAGAQLVDAALTAFGAPALIVSDRGVRWGLVAELLG